MSTEAGTALSRRRFYFGLAIEQTTNWGAAVDDQGREATKPWQMPPKALFAIAKRAWSQTSEDNIGLIAAGVAFYGFLALVPLLGAIVLVYGIAADPQSVTANMTELTSVMPTEVAKLVGEQLMNVVKTSDGKKGVGLLLALALALFGARNGAAATITALNVAYEEKEKRGFYQVNLLAIAMIGITVGVALLALVAVAALGHLQSLLPAASGAVLLAGKVSAYLLLLLTGAAAAATLYRYGPSRRHAHWAWLTPGSLFSALLWLALAIGFGIYVANFSNYNATYGSLGTVVVTLTWFYLSSYILLFGAELNSEFEHQAAQDGTNAKAPLEERGAWAADNIASRRNEGASARLPPGKIAGEVKPRPEPNEQPALAASVSGAGKLSKPKIVASVASALGILVLRKGEAVRGLGLLGVVAAIVWLEWDRSAVPPKN